MCADWSYELCCCFDDFTTCIIAYFCPCYVFGRNAEVVGDDCLLCGLCVLFWPCNIGVRTRIRGKIRDQRGIEPEKTPASSSLFPTRDNAQHQPIEYAKVQRPAAFDHGSKEKEHSSQYFSNNSHRRHSPSHQTGNYINLGNDRAPSGHSHHGPDQKKDKELDLLLLTIEEQQIQMKKYQRELEYCHDQLKQMTHLLTDKKEEIAQHVHRVASLQSDLSELRERELAATREAAANAQKHAKASSESDHLSLRGRMEELYKHAADLSRELDEERSRREYYESKLKNERRMWPNQQCQVQQQQQQTADQNRDTIKLLEAQVLIFKEDFLNERADRERAQAKILSLRGELDSLQKATGMMVNERAIGAVSRPFQHHYQPAP